MDESLDQTLIKGNLIQSDPVFQYWTNTVKIVQVVFLYFIKRYQSNTTLPGRTGLSV